MANDVKIKYDDSELKKMMRMLKKDYRVRVGILGDKAAAQHDSKSGLTNVEIGVFHEFGTSKMPQRSFLLMPLQEKLNEEIPKLKTYIFKQFFQKNAPEDFYKLLLSKSLHIIREAFETNGFGQWKALSPAYERRKINKVKTKKGREQYWFNHNILTATGKLRNSITGKIIRK